MSSSSSSLRRLVNGSSSLITSRITSSQMRSKHSISRAHNVSSERPLRQFVTGKSKSAGRNSAGRITIWHRGGGAKRLQRTVDLKRNTSSVGVVERIEYDPNRTSRIAVVRWVEGAQIDRHKKVNTVEDLAPPTRKFTPTMTVKGQFAFSSLPAMQEERKVVPFGPKTDHVYVGLPNGSKSPFTSKTTPIGTQMTNVRDVFLSAFSSSKVDKTSYSFVNTLGLPRMAVAGARPEFFVPRSKDDVNDNESLSLNEIKKWDKDSVSWAHKMKHKAAVSWQSVRGHAKSGLIELAGQKGSKLNSKTIDKQKRDGKLTEDFAPVSYILATQKMEAGKMVMNRDSSKRANDELLNRY
ncbi:putative ribosomal protein L2 [Helianthus annuus]|nr:putative ribosomal protein L2 [Helianthus annuus]KAJ0857799.1 putative ribosomal protein L2 [Helianthus annuus]